MKPRTLLIAVLTLVLLVGTVPSAAAPTPTPSGESHRELAYVSLQNESSGQLHSTIWIYDFDTASRRVFFEMDEPIGDLRWSPDGKYLLFISIPDQYRTRIYIVDSSGKLIYKGLSDTENDATWSWDSKYIAFDSYKQHSFEIMTMKFDGTEQRQLTSDPYEDYMPRWSPDDKQIVYWSRRDDPGGEIYVISATGFNRRRLTFDKMNNTSPVWSKDGKSIYFVSAQGISVMDHTGANQRLVATLNVNDMFIEGIFPAPLLSPDDTKILFPRRGKGIFLVNSDGTNDHVIVESGGAGDPTWSFDGQSVAYYDTVQGHTVVKVIKAGGTNQQQISPADVEFADSPAWEPWS